VTGTLRRSIAAVVAAALLSVSTLHVFAHANGPDQGCSVCQVQEASLPGLPAPRVVPRAVSVVAVVLPAAPAARSVRPAAATARAPPALPA
jgi:hypothetical protein